MTGSPRLREHEDHVAGSLGLDERSFVVRRLKFIQ